jgi:hypothetical protein
VVALQEQGGDFLLRDGQSGAKPLGQAPRPATFPD